MKPLLLHPILYYIVILFSFSACSSPQGPDQALETILSEASKGILGFEPKGDYYAEAEKFAAGYKKALGNASFSLYSNSSDKKNITCEGLVYGKNGEKQVHVTIALDDKVSGRILHTSIYLHKYTPEEESQLLEKFLKKYKLEAKDSLKKDCWAIGNGQLLVYNSEQLNCDVSGHSISQESAPLYGNFFEQVRIRPFITLQRQENCDEMCKKELDRLYKKRTLPYSLSLDFRDHLETAKNKIRKEHPNSKAEDFFSNEMVLFASTTIDPTLTIMGRWGCPESTISRIMPEYNINRTSYSGFEIVKPHFYPFGQSTYRHWRILTTVEIVLLEEKGTRHNSYLHMYAKDTLTGFVKHRQLPYTIDYALDTSSIAIHSDLTIEYRRGNKKDGKMENLNNFRINDFKHLQ